MHRRTFLTSCLALTAAPAWADNPSTTHAFDIGGSRVRLELGAGRTALPPEEIGRWLEGCCKALSAYYGRFPVHPLRIDVGVDRGRGFRGGVTYGGEFPVIRGRIGADSTLADLEGGWVMVHELVHLACPQVPRAHHWLEEGLATYVEPWIRIGCGQISEEKAWKDLVDGLPNGLPTAGDRGLDRTPSWGRTYWGGALFALLLDLELRRESGNERGLAELMAKRVTSGSSIHLDRTMDELMAEWDEAAGSSLPGELYRSHKHTAVTVDLAPVWKALGVTISGRAVSFDDTAPEAALRKAISSPPRR